MRSSALCHDARMRVLFASTAGSGHFGPLVPIAQLLVDAGHDVLVTAPEGFEDTVAATGLAFRPFGAPSPAALGAVFGRLPHVSMAEANRIVVQEVFAGLDVRAGLPGVREIVADWSPDLVAREPAELASLLAAGAAGVPQVQVAIGMATLTSDFGVLLAEPLEPLAADLGLPPGRVLDQMFGSPQLSSVPPSLDTAPDGWVEHASRPLGPTWRYRTTAPPTQARLPEPWGDPDAPLVYATFGSVAGALGPFAGCYPATLAELADQPVRVLLTTGHAFDRDQLGPVPPNAHVEAWWPQADVMAATSAVVGHGGFGTTMTAAVAGVPQIVIPLFAADQFENASRMAGVGAGLALDGGLGAFGRLAAAVQQVLGDPAYRDAADRVRLEMAALPELATHLPALEALASAL